MRLSLSLLLPTAMFLATTAAVASPTFPDALKAAVPQLGCIPQCTLCHATNLGGIPAAKPFASDMKTFGGLTLGKPETVAPAVQKLQMQGAAADADKDGKGDYDELLAGTDPNSANPADAICTEAPAYGCGASTIARHAPAGGSTPFWFAGLAMLVGAVARRFKQR